MSNVTIALLHPGDMGSAVGGCAVRRGHTVLCALNNRSQASGKRAAAAGMQNAGSEEAAVKQAAVVLSVCPPHGALDLARRVAGFGFRGLFVDANAIALCCDQRCSGGHVFPSEGRDFSCFAGGGGRVRWWRRVRPTSA